MPPAAPTHTSAMFKLITGASPRKAAAPLAWVWRTVNGGRAGCAFVRWRPDHATVPRDISCEIGAFAWRDFARFIWLATKGLDLSKSGATPDVDAIVGLRV